MLNAAHVAHDGDRWTEPLPPKPLVFPDAAELLKRLRPGSNTKEPMHRENTWFVMVSEATFRSWIADLRLEATVPVFLLSARSGYVRDRVTSLYLPVLIEQLCLAFGEVREVEITIRRKRTHQAAPSENTEGGV